MQQQTWNPAEEDLEVKDVLRYQAADVKRGSEGNTTLDEDEDDIPPSQGG